MKSIASSSSRPCLLALRVERRLQEVGVVDAGNLDRVLERHEHAVAGALVGIHVEQVLAVVEHLAVGDLVAGMARQRPGERALAGSVRTHDGVHFALVDGEIDALEDLAILDANFQILDLQHVLTDRPFQ